MQRTLALAAAGVGAAYLIKKLLASSGEEAASSFPSAAPREGFAAVHRLTAVDRKDKPSGSKPGPPGKPACEYLSTGPQEGELAFAELVGEPSGGERWMLYSIEEVTSDSPTLVFLELPQAAIEQMYVEEAFIDRGVRKLVPSGARVAIASLKTAEAWLVDDAVAGCLFGEGSETSLGVVWNTGRCGSTLMGKALIAVGAAAVSEPHWCDQLTCKPPHAIPQPRLCRAFAACMQLEAILARRAVPRWAGARCVVLNPKSGGEHVAAACAAVFPAAKHIYMYRACHKVVESFGGLLAPGPPSLPAKLRWRIFGRWLLMPVPMRARVPALSELSEQQVGMMTLKYLTQVAGWVGLIASRAHLGAADPLVRAPPLRMDEFTSKDVRKRAAVLRAALEALGALAHMPHAAQKEEALQAAAGVFAVHSQAGSAMSGPKAKFLEEADGAAIYKCVSQALGGTQAVEVQKGGANILLKGSLGA